MDATRFDRLARAFGQPVSRRQVGAIAAALVLGAIPDAGAVPTSRNVTTPRTVCRPYGTGCTRNSQCCTGVCETRRSAPRAIRNRCQCPAGENRCGVSCVPLDSDTDNCGECGHVCDPDTASACTSGACTCGQWDACDAGVDCTGTHCNACKGSTDFTCWVLANGEALSGNYAHGGIYGPTACRTTEDCSSSIYWVCNPGETMFCMAAFYEVGNLTTDWPTGNCHCVTL